MIVDLDGTPYARPVAARRVMPYFARTRVELPQIFVDSAMAPEELLRLEDTIEEGED